MKKKDISVPKLKELQKNGWTFRNAYLDDSDIGSRPNKNWRMLTTGPEYNYRRLRPIVLIKP